MVNVRQKPISALVFKRGGRGIVPQLPPVPTDMPDPPDGIGPYALEAWAHFWRTPVSGLVDMNRDGERIRHWARCVHERRRLWDMWAASPLMKDANNALRGNPLFRQISTLTADIERAEQHFGMTPLAKMRLTGALDQAEKAETSIKARRDRRPSVA